MMTESNSYLTDWMSADDLSQIVKVGDLIEFQRSLIRNRVFNYGHWAVYVGVDEGEHYAVHMSTDAGDFDASEIRSKILGHGCSARVRRDTIKVIAAGSICRVNNCLDSRVNSLPPQEVRDRALNSIGNSGYNIFQNNCEHFVKSCRYGSHESTQGTILTSIGITTGVAVASSSLPLGVCIGLAGYTCLSIKNAIDRYFASE